MTFLQQQRTNIKNWMRGELAQFKNDYLNCGEINCTLLAENCADVLNLYIGDEYTIPEEVFDLAVDVAEEFEKPNPDVIE